MDIDFDPAKDAANIAKHGVSLALAAEMDLAVAKVGRSDRNGEVRFIAYGAIFGVVYGMVFTVREGVVRPISLRPASRKERRNL